MISNLLLSKLIHRLDNFSRKDFKNKFIVSERDYISILLNRIRQPFGPFYKIALAHSQTISGSYEQKYGCDGIIIFKINDGYKVGLFEAKILKKSRMDSPVGPRIGPKDSRFQRQLYKQSHINPDIAVWEMFLNNDTFNAPFHDTFGSTCVKYDIAIKHHKSSSVWTYLDFEKILKDSYSANGNIPVNIADIVYEILSCRFGRKISLESKGLKLFSNEEIGKDNLLIPFPDNDISNETIEDINDFLNQSGIYSYTYIDLRNYDDQFVEKLLNTKQ